MVQGYELIDGVPVVYSLGNAVFGGNRDPLIMMRCFCRPFLPCEDGAPVRLWLVFHPISVSGETSYNNYQPVLLWATTRSACWTRWPIPPAYAARLRRGAGAETEAFPVGGA